MPDYNNLAVYLTYGWDSPNELRPLSVACVDRAQPQPIKSRDFAPLNYTRKPYTRLRIDPCPW